MEFIDKIETFIDKGINDDNSARPSYHDFVIRTRLEKRF